MEKKKSAKKTTKKEVKEVKKTTSKKTKKTTKKPVKKTTKKVEQKEKFYKSTKFLVIVFVVLLLLVGVLGVVSIIKKQEYDKKIKANIVLPVIREEQFEFSINAKELASAKGYIFKVTNHRKGKVNKKDMSYDVFIENGSNSVIEITKNKSKKDLMTEQVNTVIENQKLPKNEEVTDYYTIKTKSSGKLGKQEMINIKVIGKNG